MSVLPLLVHGHLKRLIFRFILKNLLIRLSYWLLMLGLVLISDRLRLLTIVVKSRVIMLVWNSWVKILQLKVVY